jgi:hypothetical protein
MKELKLEVDVYSHWNDNPPVYRMYVNEELFSERTFVWPSFKAYIKEHIWCKLDEGLHILRLENLSSDSKFDLANFKLNSTKVGDNFYNIYDSKLEWIFFVKNESLA